MAHKCDDRELKVTAAVLAHFHGPYFKEHGFFPPWDPNLSWPYCACSNSIIRTRGFDITLTEDEQLIYEFLVKVGAKPSVHFTGYPGKINL